MRVEQLQLWFSLLPIFITNTLTITTDFPSVCIGQPNAFHATGHPTYTWNPSYIINNQPSGKFCSGILQQLLDGNGCKSN